MNLTIRNQIMALALVFFTIVAISQENIIPGELIIHLEKQADIEEWCSELGDQTSLTIIPVRSLSHSMNLWQVACSEQNVDMDQLLNAAWRMKETKIAQYNHSNITQRLQPNDALFGNQWSLYNDGTNGGSGNADIDALGAWDISTGGLTAKGDTIVVAVIDGGYRMDHPDLIDNYFTNHGEIPSNGIDDDGNGYIDDVQGWNAYNNSGTIWQDNHGTHVAGIIGARGNNSFGVAGVNWDVKVLPICGSSSQESTVIAAYGYVLDMRKLYNETNGASGAYIVSTNSSFGVDYGNPSNYPLWCAMYDSMGVAGVISAGATANLNIDIDVQGDVPTACASNFLLSVTNTTSSDTKNSGAAYGETTIDLGAPGTSIHSTTLNGYGNLTGTSMATPHVAGAVALMYSAMCEDLMDQYGSPALLATFVRNQLLTHGVDQVSNLSGLVATGGRLNLQKAVQSVSDSCFQVDFQIVDANCGDCDGSIVANVSGGIAPYTYNWSTGSTSNSISDLCAGSYDLTVTDSAGTVYNSSASVSDQGGPVVTFTVEDAFCNGGSDGEVTLTGADNYLWSDGSTASARNDLSAGFYSITATNSGDSCETVVTVEVGEPEGMDVEFETIIPVPYSASNGSIKVMVSGGIAPYSYLWDNGDTSDEVFGLAVGDYFVTITDAQGCEQVEEIRLGFPVGMEEHTFDQVSIFPNPALSQVSITSGGLSELNVQLLDLMGRVVLESSINGNMTSLDLSALSSGQYVLRLISGDEIDQRLLQVIQ